MVHEPYSFTHLQVQIDAIQDQVTGDPYAVAQCGEPYVEFMTYGISREADVKAVEGIVARQMHERLNTYFAGKSGRIYWRCRLEMAVDDCDVVSRFYFGDSGWKIVKMYCRLYRATLQTVDVIDAQRRAA